MKCVAFSALRKQHAVIAEDADLESHDTGKTGDQRITVERLEFVQLAAVDQAGDNVAVVGGDARIGADRP